MTQDEFPEIFPCDHAMAIAELERSPEVLGRWLMRAIEEVEELRALTECFSLLLEEANCKVSCLEAKERVRIFEEKYVERCRIFKKISDSRITQILK